MDESKADQWKIIEPFLFDSLAAKLSEFEKKLKMAIEYSNPLSVRESMLQEVQAELPLIKEAVEVYRRNCKHAAQYLREHLNWIGALEDRLKDQLKFNQWLAYSKGIAAGGAIVTSTEDGGGAYETTGVSKYTLAGGFLPGDWMYTSGNHNHGGSTGAGGADGHTHPIYTDGGHVHARDTDHDHYFDVPDHNHLINILPHTHDIEYGIFQGPTPTAVTIAVDGNVIPHSAISGEDIDIVPYLAKDEQGKILRGAWHTITITPNNLGRIVASIFTQLFVQSRGGGNY